MARQNKPIHVAAGADDNYAMPLAVLICSILKNQNKETVLHFYVLDGGINDKNRDRLTNVFESCGNKENNSFKWIKPDLNNIKHLPANGRPPSVYLPLLLPDLLPQDCKKVIFLDCDLILETDIQKLWNHDMEGTAIWAARDVLIQILSDVKGVKTYKELGGAADSPYFNSGVMVINLDYWRREGIHGKAIDYLLQNGDTMYHCDQEALNAVLIDKWNELDPRWNQQGSIYWPQVLPESEFTDSIMRKHYKLVNNPFIIHYLSPNKPWNYTCMHPNAHKFLYYLKESGWFSKTEWTLWWYILYFKRFFWLCSDLIHTLNKVKIGQQSSNKNEAKS